MQNISDNFYKLQSSFSNILYKFYKLQSSLSNIPYKFYKLQSRPQALSDFHYVKVPNVRRPTKFPTQRRVEFAACMFAVAFFFLFANDMWADPLKLIPPRRRVPRPVPAASPQQQPHPPVRAPGGVGALLHSLFNTTHRRPPPAAAEVQTPARPGMHNPLPVQPNLGSPFGKPSPEIAHTKQGRYSRGSSAKRRPFIRYTYTVLDFLTRA